MTINQTNKRAMFGRVTAMINQRMVLFAGLSAFATAFEKFQNLLEDIDHAVKEKNSSGAGAFMIRDASEETLKNILVEVASALFLYAGKAKLADVKALVSVKRSDLERMPLVELGQTAKSISELAARYATHLTVHGVDANKLTKLNAALIKFQNSTSACGMGVNGQAVSLRDLFQEADTLLNERLDKMVETLKRKHPEFYHKYQAARVVEDVSSSHRKEELAAAEMITM
jgi:hypothetical protein